jgi:hypothetical protein
MTKFQLYINKSELKYNKTLDFTHKKLIYFLLNVKNICYYTLFRFYTFKLQVMQSNILRYYISFTI